MRNIHLVLAMLGSALPLVAADFPLTVEDSGSKEVDAEVLHLISTRPAPHPSNYGGLLTTDESLTAPYMTPEVRAAIAALKKMGPPIFPALVKQLADDRYSFSDISAAWDNHTVGDAITEVLSDGHYMYSGYKSRQTPSGSAGYLSFDAYLRAREPEKWAEWARTKSRLAIQMDFIDWCVSQEHERGFVDESQRKHILGIYQHAQEQVRKEYSEPSGSANGSQAIRTETNRTSSAAGSRR